MAEGQQGSGFTLPAKPDRVPGLPENFHLFTFDGFDGLNTKPTRPAIQDQQMYWCDNFIPLGKNNLRTLYDVGTPIYTATGGLTISYFAFGNFGDTPICMVFLSDGSIVQVNTSTLATTTVGPPGTIITPTAQIGVTQWGSQYILIVAPQPDGYLIWDGSFLYRAGTIGPLITINNAGDGYSTQPNMVAISGRSGVAQTTGFTATIVSSGSITTITTTSLATGYNATDAVFIAFSGGMKVGLPSRTTAIAYASVVAGAVTSVNIVNPGSGYGAQTILTFVGGGGTGATATVTASGSVNSVTLTNGGQGYAFPPALLFTDANNTVAQATIATMPFGVQGTSIETFQSRVWIANGDAPSVPPPKSRVLFTAPGAVADFGNGGGSFLSNDSFTRVGYHGIRASNGFLYLIGDSSVNTITGVATSGSPPITTFANQNVDPQVGTPWPDSIQVFSRAVVMANTFGVHALYGGAVQKVSASLDGIYTTVTPTGVSPAYGSLVPSSAVAVVFGIHLYILLLPIIDPISGTQRNALLIWDGARWFTANPSVSLIRISSQEINSVLTAYGSTGSAIYPLFNTASAMIQKVVLSKLWDTPSYIMTKHAQTVFGLFQSNSDDAVGFTIGVDTENGTTQVNQTNIFGATWTATTGTAVWTATGGATVVWQTSGLAAFNAAIDATGVLMGLRLTTTAKDMTLISLSAAAQQYTLNL